MDTIPRNLNRAIPSNLFDTKIDKEIQYLPNIDYEWEDMMIGGPLSINYMSSVMAIASKKDFPFVAGFNHTYIKYPTSFRTTLVQVMNDMHKALSGAHTGMDRIQANMRQIPNSLRTALILITQARPSLIKSMLPRHLLNIGRYANDSASIARATLSRFEDLQNLLREIFEFTTLTDQKNKEVAEQLQAETEEIMRNQTHIDELRSNLAAEYKSARQRLEKAQQDYHIAMMNVPGGQWDEYAWQVYAANRPAESCSGWWIFSLCSSVREQQFHEFTQEAKWKAEETLQILKEAEDYSKELFNKQLDRQNEMAIAINHLATLNFAEMSNNEIIKVLIDAAQQIAKVQEQWSRITRLFSKLAMETENTQNVILENFLGIIADSEMTGKPLEPTDKMLYVTLLMESAADIDRDSHLLFLLAKTYTDVSNEYMIDQVVGFIGLVFLQTDAERDNHLKEMASKTVSTSNRIKELATERQTKYSLTSLARQQQYTEFVKEVDLHEAIDILSGIGVGKRR
ncbi:unnamed protein product [Rotaria sordida]|uniref:Uncharacterized protein n=1 Tax=Rotaria sordida TaxID=392033 RepID=A0A816B4R3_9BILA|nr:unnamed protein product [Rotaria sordida]CAF1606671.1 unnamed protein product [Rotaria sordida]